MIDISGNLENIGDIACTPETLRQDFSESFWKEFIDSLKEAFEVAPMTGLQVNYSVTILYCLTRIEPGGSESENINKNILKIKNLCSSHRFLNILNRNLLNYPPDVQANISLNTKYWKFIYNLFYARTGNRNVISRKGSLDTNLSKRLFITLSESLQRLDLSNPGTLPILVSQLNIIQNLGTYNEVIKADMINEGVGTSLLTLFVKLSRQIQSSPEEYKAILKSTVSAFINMVYTDNTTDKRYITAVLREAMKGSDGAALLNAVVQALEMLRIYVRTERNYLIDGVNVSIIIGRIRDDIIRVMSTLVRPPSSGISGLASVRTGPASVVSSLGRPLAQRPGTFGTGTSNAPLGRLGARHIVGRGGKRRTVRRKTRNIRHYKNGRSRRNS